jgi:radical SAM protein with 4Fe4S-binding SPASM domain
MEYMKCLINQIEPIPQECVWELTLKCNLRCIHCGSAAGCSRKTELSTKEALSLADQLADEGCKVVGLSGGEPIMRPDWDSIARRCSKRSVEARLLTNGWAFNQDVAKRAKDAGVSCVSFSIDGDEPTHDFLRAAPGSYQRVMKGIEAAFQEDLPPVVITQCSKYNLCQLERIHNTLAAIGIRSWQIQITHAWGRAAKDIQIRPQDAWLVHDFVVEKKKRGSYPQVYAGDDVGYYTENESLIRDINQLGVQGPGMWMGCFAGVLAVGIESNGNIKGCLSMPPMFVEGNIRTRSFHDIWNDKKAFAYNRQPSPDNLKGACHDCDMNDFCRGGCKSMGAQSFASFEYPYCLSQIKRRNTNGSKNRGSVEQGPESPRQKDAGSSMRQPRI